MRTILFGWELGTGRGHLEPMRPIVAALLANDWTVIAAVRDLKGGHAVLGTIDPKLRHRRFAVGQAPIFVHRATPPSVRPGSLAEILAHMGFADQALLHPVVTCWGDLIDRLRPDVAITDFAPSLVIAARMRQIPVVATGSGWTVPPNTSPVPPLPIGSYDPIAAFDAEERVCRTIAAVTDDRWRPSRFVEALRGDTNFILSSPLLDPYRASRAEALSWPPHLIPPLQRPEAERSRAVLYLPRHHPTVDRVLQALEITRTPTLAYCGGLGPVAPSKVTVSAEPIDLADTLSRAPYMIHHGGLGVSGWCLAYGVPQVILPTDLEKGLNAHAIMEAGAGIVVPLDAPALGISQAIARARRMTSRISADAGLAHNDPQATLDAIVAECAAAVA